MDIFSLAPPKYLYKYRTLRNFEYITKNNSLYFYDPLEEYNDPFDCMIKPFLKGTYNEIEEWSKKFLLRNNEDLSKKEFKKLLKIYKTHIHATYKENTKIFLDDYNFQMALRSSDPDRAKNIGVLSLTEKNNDILMFTHYGDNHKGLGLQFEMKKDPYYYANVFPVKYFKSYPQLNVLNSNSTERLEKMLFTKSAQWNYEKEWRIIKKEGSGPSQFKRSMLTGIIFGTATTKASKDYVFEVTKDRNIKYFQAVPKKRRFELKITPLIRY